ncbi:MAG: phosphate acyltransferase PlsX [Candidatus Eremiobacter antarcticus]|nr:phosphate acyltransferase PlsX [Candidatus Eremiobacteraeota bacterium]MBC5808657.1 phosphate acyltransferase PlsX [Candidatus Eremiobacteraeota bacterium]PZR62146.1 MAG: phosphate acyltransferase PlsX [Candidatus Eremiobacter sp. RRmetagenome_bin22]
MTNEKRAADVCIAVDGMGGDYAPEQIVAGSCDAARILGCRVVIVGDRERIERLLPGTGVPPNVAVVHADGVVAMDEAPAAAIRRGASTSMGASLQLVRDGTAQGVFSAGNSGAFLALATIRLRTLAGIARPAFATAWPARKGPMLLLDAGANVDCRAEWLLQFAIMGSAYAKVAFNIASPKVGLLSVGTEEGKGNALTEAAFSLLSTAPVEFIGNVEGGDLLLGDADVVVCDGFVGNVALKLAESAGEYFFGVVKETALSTLRGKLGILVLKPSLRAVRKRFDHREHGGAPLLGVRGVCIIGHGRADAKTVVNACRVALRAVQLDLVGSIGSMLSTLPPASVEAAT